MRLETEPLQTCTSLSKAVMEKPSRSAKASYDDELLAQVAGGDRNALKVLYLRYGDRLQKFAQVWLADPFAASDIVHETFIDVWRGAAGYGARASVKSWIFTIARNKAVDRNRRAAPLVVSDRLPETPDHSLGPRALLVAAQDAAILRECVNELSAAHRAVIHLMYFEHLTYRDIAEIEGCPVGTVKSRIAFAKKQLVRLVLKKCENQRHLARPSVLDVE